MDRGWQWYMGCGGKRAGGCALVLLSVLCGLTGCGSETEEPAASRQQVVNLRAIYLGNEPEDGMEELYEQLDALTIPELGCILRFEFVPWGNERKQINIAAASGEYDFIPEGVFSDYRILVSKNAFVDMNDYLDAVPELVEHYSYYSDTFLEDSEINGGLYGLPQFGGAMIQGDSEGFLIGKTSAKSGGWSQWRISVRWRRICTGRRRIPDMPGNL